MKVKNPEKFVPSWAKKSSLEEEKKNLSKMGPKMYTFAVQCKVLCHVIMEIILDKSRFNGQKQSLHNKDLEALHFG